MYQKYRVGQWSMLSQRQHMSPFPNYMSMKAVCREMEKYVGARLHGTMMFFQGNIFYAFHKANDFHKTAAFFAKQIHQKPLLYASLVKKQEKLGRALVYFAKQANKLVRKGKVSNRQLYRWFAGYETRYKEVYAIYGSVWVAEDYFMNDLLKIVEKRIKNNPVKAAGILNILTKQPKAMVATRERKVLLKMALKVGENPKWVEWVQNQEIGKIKAEPGLKKLIQKHVADYFWLTRDYEDPILDFEKIVERLKGNLKPDLKQEYNKLVTQFKNDIVQQKKFSRELKLNQEEMALFSAMRDMAHLKELRKRFVAESLYYFDAVLNEIGRRTFWSLRQVRFLRTEDAEQAILKNRNFSTELNERIKLSLWQVVDGRRTEVTIGKKAEEMFKKFCRADKDVKEFKGMPVSPGIAKGPARVIMNPDECGKVQKGDIIVTVQVVPSFSTAILKAGGIVCDGGHGITSHPATLAREARIPCVIQTRFAREVLKDGDMVEVDGYKGAVRKL